MAQVPQSPSPGSDSPPSNGVSWRSVWAQRLWWLISALSGTLSIEEDIKRLKKENAQIRKETEQIRNERLQRRKEDEQIKNETEQIKKERLQRRNEYEQRSQEYERNMQQMRKENERLAVLESKIDGLFSKYGISFKPANKPDQP